MSEMWVFDFMKVKDTICPRCKVEMKRGEAIEPTEVKGVRAEYTFAKSYPIKLIKVWKKDGVETWMLCHIEVDGNPRKKLPERMMTYRYRIRDRHNKPIISIAILIDDNPYWQIDNYREECYGSSLEIKYLIVKLLDYQSRRQELEVMNNCFATVMLAQLAVLETRGNPKARLQAKTALTRKLYEKGFGKSDIIQLVTLIDWLIALPEELMIEYNLTIKEIEEKKHMNFVTTPQRVGRIEGFKKGLEQGLEQGLETGLQKGEAALLTRQLQRRFHHLPNDYLTQIEQADADTLLLWGERIFDAATLEEVFN